MPLIRLGTGLEVFRKKGGLAEMHSWNRVCSTSGGTRALGE